MAMIKKSISVTEQQNAWIQSQLASGQFASDSEVIRAAIRMKQREQDELEYLKGRLEAARRSGIVDQSPEEMLAEFKAELKRDATL